MSEKDLVLTEETKKEKAEGTAATDEGKEHSRHHHHSHHHSRHGHGHHGHHSRRHRHGSGKRRKKGKLATFIRHNKKKVIYCGLAIVFVIVLLLFSLNMDTFLHQGEQGDNGTSQGNGQTKTEAALQLEVPFFQSQVSLVNPAVTAYMNVNVDVPANEVFEEYRGDEGKNRLDQGLPVTLSYKVLGIPEGYTVKKAVAYVSENADFSAAKSYTMKSTDTSVKIPHLKVATKYYYRFDITLSNKAVTSVSGSFETADTPRILSVDGIANVRDVGGWMTASGRRIKQGLLYRGTELEGAVASNYSITDKGIKTLLAEFGVRTDMDLRPESDNKTGVDALGVGVEHIYYAAPMYDAAFEESGREALRAVFADLANPAKYPVYLHCTHGLDRTGTAVYILQALLGVSEEDLMREYQLSSLHHGELWAADQMQEFVALFRGIEGATMQDKAETYLRAAGVTREEIDSIRRIFLGE